jgi:hypothetical protein
VLSIGLAPDKTETMYCELHSHVNDHLMAGMEEVIGLHGKNHIRVIIMIMIIVIIVIIIMIIIMDANKRFFFNE